MHDDKVSLRELKRGQQLLRDHIAENDRLIGEAAQRVATSRAITGAPDAGTQDNDEAREDGEAA